MATQKWIAGTVGLTWADAGFSTELNSLGINNAVLAANALDNSSNLDQLADLSISLGSVTPAAGAPFIGIYLIPLNQDGSSYGDGRFASAAAGPPPSEYLWGFIKCKPSTAGVITGMVRKIELPPGSFKFCLHNGSGVALASGSNTVKWRTYDNAIA